LSLQDQLSADVDIPDSFVSSEQWAGFLQEVLETTVTAYLMLKHESTARSDWKEDTFTLNIVRCMKQFIRTGKTSFLISKYTDGGSRFHWERGSLAGVFDVQFWLKDAEVLDLLTFCVYTYFIEGKVKI
jgi:hypothetical protein